jgi:uncharacterized protein (TIGR02646 family)
MRRLNPATIEATLLARLHSHPSEHQKKIWEYTGGDPREFKDSLTTQLRTEQNRRCAYCGRRLIETKTHRDHIAPKETYPEFTFVPLNLVLACYHCNTDRKGTTNTISVRSNVYRDCVFTIIHPYLDDPQQHIEFVGGDLKLLIKVVNDSAKGTATIELFGLADTEMALQRFKDGVFDKDTEHLPGNWKQQVLQMAFDNIKPQLRN